MCTLVTSPIAAMKPIIADPPYDKNGRGIPATGMIPMFMPTFSKTEKTRRAKTPEQMSRP
jgi:hypothetical protein